MSETSPAAGPDPGGGAGTPEGLSALSDSSSQVMQEVLASNYHAIEERVSTNPVPTQEELEIGCFLEGVQPQVRDALLSMRSKGYDVGNVLHAGYIDEQSSRQGMTLQTPLSPIEVAMFEENGFTVADGRVSFEPAQDADFDTLKGIWDWFAASLPDLGLSVGPAMFGNAIAFREAASTNSLLDFYMPGGVLNPIGVKYVRERDPFADLDLGLSADVMAATREVAFIDQYHELKARLENNPEPTVEELNMGVYREELEPQVRDAVMVLRAKGYNTGSSGFWGESHVEQRMDIDTPIDDATRALLSEFFVEVTDTGIRFTPEHPTDLASVKQTWDTIADVLPDLGHHARPSQTERAHVFRHVAEHRNYNDYLQDWLYASGALSGSMHPLTVTILNEGYNFGPNVYEPAQRAAARHKEMAGLSS